MSNQKLTIGLFGTCGDSHWRDPFIDYIKCLNNQHITYFNPQLPKGEWTPEFADIENHHFKTDDIILFPVTNQTTAFGSLGEVGFSIQSLIQTPSSYRTFVFMIDDDCLDPQANEFQINDSVRMRKLVKSKLLEIYHPNIFLVNTLDDIQRMLPFIIEHHFGYQKLKNFAI